MHLYVNSNLYESYNLKLHLDSYTTGKKPLKSLLLEYGLKIKPSSLINLFV